MTTDHGSLPVDDPLWFRDAIIYELHVRAFADSNGDGIGDFPGLITRLDYLRDLGVTALWLLPFYPSPLRDDGYDIADYRTVNPIYGNLDDGGRQGGMVHLDTAELGVGDQPFRVRDLVGGGRYTWHGSRNYVELDPYTMPAHVFAIERA